MFYDALGFTVLCLPVILILSIGVPLVIVVGQRFRQVQAKKGKKEKKSATDGIKTNRALSILLTLFKLTRLFLTTFVALSLLAFLVWVMFLTTFVALSLLAYLVWVIVLAVRG